MCLKGSNLKIFDDKLVGTAKKVKQSHGWTFQQNNDKKHAYKSTERWINDHGIKHFP